MRNTTSLKPGESQEIAFRKLKKLMETLPQVDRNRTPPSCRICPFFQPGFRYRKCLYAECPYGKKAAAIYRRRPLRSERIIAGGGDMRV